MQQYFRLAIQECNIRCLKNSSKYLSELLLGMNEENDDSRINQNDLLACVSSNREYDTIQFVLSILNNGEYQRSTQCMRSFITSHKNSKKNAKPLSKISRFLYLYSLYMAGEMLKDQQEEEHKANGNKNPNLVPNTKTPTTPNKSSSNSILNPPKNPCLLEIYNELHPMYIYTMNRHHEIDCCHLNTDTDMNRNTLPLSPVDEELLMDSYLLYIYGVILREIKRQGGGAIVYGNKEGNRSHNVGNKHNLNSNFNTNSSSCTCNINNNMNMECESKNHLSDTIINQYANEFIELDQIHSEDTGGPHSDYIHNIPKSSAYYVLLHALCMNPLNWSCWLELGNICLVEKYPLPFDLASINQLLNRVTSISNTKILSGERNIYSEQTIEEIGLGLNLDKEVVTVIYTYLHGNQKYIELFRTLSLCFLVYIYLEQHNGEEALKICQQYLINIFPNSAVIQANIALCYYTLRDYNIAHQCFGAVREKDPYRMEHIDTYSNILYVKECRSELSYLAHSVMKINKYTTQTCCIVGNYYSLKGQHEKAILYFRRAIKINHNYLSAWTLMGHEFVELANTSAAVYCYRRAIEISGGNDYRAWYGLGQTYEMLHLYQYAYYYYKKSAELRPHDSRMWCAIGSCLYHMASSMDTMGLNVSSKITSNIYKQEVIHVYKRALECGDNEGIAMKQLPKLYKEIGCYDKAVELYEHYYLCDIINNINNSSIGNNLNSNTDPIMSTSGNSIGITTTTTTTTANINNNPNNSNHSPRSTPTGQYPMLDIDISNNSIHSNTPFKLNIHSPTTPAIPIPNTNTTTISNSNNNLNTKNIYTNNSVYIDNNEVPTNTNTINNNISTISSMSNSNIDLSICLHPSIQVINSILTNKDKIDALLFVATYYKNIKKYKKAEIYCMYLLDVHGNEGNEARSMLREIRNLKK